jgi:peptide/nickel transport system substrate-binding protein
MRTAHRAVGVVMLVGALVATACSSGSNTSKQAGPATTTSPPRQELTVGTIDDQFVVSGARANLASGYNVLETLTLLSPQYEVKPLLAERWEFRAPNTWRFFLRHGVTFHDGQPFNAQAVKTGLFDRVAKTPGGGTIKAGPDSAVVVDDFTVDFTPTAPNLRIPEQIVHPTNGVAAPGTTLESKPVGTGPFRFVEYQPKDHLTVERFDGYWGPKPKLDRITFRFIPDNNTRRLALESGQVDYILNVPTGDVKSLKDKGFTVATSAVGAYDALYLNIHGKPPYDLLSDQVVRQAIAYSIDRKAIATGVLDGQATADPTMVPPASLGQYASTVKGYAFDPAKAKSTLDAAGWKPGSDGIRSKEGRRLHLQLVSGLPTAEALRPIPAFLQSELKDVGIDLEIVERPDTPSYQSLITSGQGDIFIEQGNQNDGNPSFLPVLLFCNCGSGASADYVGLFGPGPAFDNLITPALSEVDLDKVRKETADAMHLLIDEQAVVVPLAGIPRVSAMKKQVQGFVAHPSSINTRWDSISIG